MGDGSGFGTRRREKVALELLLMTRRRWRAHLLSIGLYGCEGVLVRGNVTDESEVDRIPMAKFRAKSAQWICSC
ncbi:MAG: hypothetical protein M2R45_04108 [Verrucomicrobia subdivision 3 bacterium]|nr:hypothetical protein [Limisphaerales bacterium]MCS1417091.1 hypothetical protein [Limisphaerales bacterium]